MRTLFYVAEKRWSGCARAFVSAGRGLLARGHQVTIVCCAHGEVEMRALEAGLDVVTIPREASMAADAWWLRKLLRDRFVEVAFVYGERRQVVVSGAMRLAERGAVIRRIAPFEALSLQRSGRLATRVAATGILFSTEEDRRSVGTGAFPIPAAVAPLGVTPDDEPRPEESVRAELGAPIGGTLVACAYDASARHRFLAVLRTLALLAPRHVDLHVILTGPGSEDEELRLHASALGVGHLVTFLGDRGADRTAFRAADVGWVIASGDDGAYAMLDCMALGLPVLADRSPLAEHYVRDGITGVLLPTDQPAPIVASAVASFLAGRERRAAMGAAGRARVVREFPEEALVDGFERALNEAGDRSRWATA